MEVLERLTPYVELVHLLLKVNYTIKCNTLGEQKEVHTEPW